MGGSCSLCIRSTWTIVVERLVNRVRNEWVILEKEGKFYLSLKERLYSVWLLTPNGGEVGPGGEGLEPFVYTQNQCQYGTTNDKPAVPYVDLEIRDLLEIMTRMQ